MAQYLSSVSQGLVVLLLEYNAAWVARLNIGPEAYVTNCIRPDKQTYV